MSWVHRSLPPERDDDPPPEIPAREALEAERADLIKLVRRGVQSERQRRILKRIAAITLAILTASKGTEQ
jgi:hypothetical protein